MVKTKVVLFFITMVGVSLNLCCKYVDTMACVSLHPKTLFTVSAGRGNGTTGYGHYVLIEGLSKSCADSLSMVNMALDYCDTVKHGRPVGVIMFFNSDKDFIKGEESQVMENINRSCLATIGFNLKSGKPNTFIFYNEDGERTYLGDKWLPDGEN